MTHSAGSDSLDAASETHVVTFYVYDPKEHPDEAPALSKCSPIVFRHLTEAEAELIADVCRRNGSHTIVRGEPTDREAVASAYAESVMQYMREERSRA